MIATLSGKLEYKSPQYVIVNIFGIGMQVNIPLSTYYNIDKVGDNITLSIHTHLRQDLIQLFGFNTREEKELFELLISISKVGPKLAISILSSLSSSKFKEAVIENDITKLSSIPGVGKKTAQRLVIELKDKVKKEMQGIVNLKIDRDIYSDLLSALTNLGYKLSEVEKVAGLVISGFSTKPSIEVAIRESLKLLSK